MTRTVVIDAANPDPDAIADAARLLRAGGVVAFPTETVYGLGAHALDEPAVRRVFEAKGRPSSIPLIVHLSDGSEAESVVAAWPDRAARLAAAFWPGPLTLILPRAAGVPDVVTGGLDTVGIRVPAHPVARALLRAAAIPLAAPSANPHTGISPTSGAHVLAGLADRVDLLLDAGPTPVGIESTVLDLTTAPPRLLRPGAVSARSIRAVVGDLAAPAAEVGSGRHRSPGLSARHYAPRATLRRLSDRAPADPRPAGALLTDREVDGVDREERMPDDPEGYSRRLYAALHEMDAAGMRTVYVEDLPSDEAWDAIRDRLRRAMAPPT